MDREDWLYVGGALVSSAGCAWIYPPAGLICVGCFALLPPLVSLFRAKGPTE
jgi:hypothetical protein